VYSGRPARQAHVRPLGEYAQCGRPEACHYEPQVSSNDTLSALNTGVNHSMVPELDFTYMALDHVGVGLGMKF